MESRPLRIVLVDDHEMVLQGLKAMLLPFRGRVRVVGEAHGDQAALDAVATLSPDIVLCDVRLQGASGLDLCRRLIERRPGQHVVLLSVYEDEQYLFEALRAARLASGEYWPGARHGLTHRESEVLALVVSGLSNRGIAKKLMVGDETVKTHLRSIYRKLRVNDRAGAVATALREGIFR